jgi:gamma-glutamylcyclotransferase (GGCT)/AIG2-like uncharacterized protein YtfP
MEKNQSQDPKNGVLYAVYGTLRVGFGNNRLLNNEHCTYLGTEITAPKFHMVSLGGFPGVILNGKQSITIEVFRVNSKDVEQRLDWLEGYPSFYQKTVIDTQWGKTNMYILNDSYLKNKQVESGDWAKYINKIID